MRFQSSFLLLSILFLTSCSSSKTDKETNNFDIENTTTETFDFDIENTTKVNYDASGTETQDMEGHVESFFFSRRIRGVIHAEVVDGGNGRLYFPSRDGESIETHLKIETEDNKQTGRGTLNLSHFVILWIV